MADYNNPLQVKDASPKGVKYEVLLEKSPDYPHDGHKFQNGKEAVVLKRDGDNLHSKSKLPENGLKPHSSYDEVNLKRGSHGNPLLGREEPTSKTDRGYWKEGSTLKPSGSSSQDKRVENFDGGSNPHDGWVNAARVRERPDAATARKSPSHAGFHSKNNVNELFGVNHGSVPDVDNSERKVQKDETPRLKPYYNNAIPPPYVKPNSKLKSSTHGTNSVQEKPHAASTSERNHLALDNSEQDLQAIRHARPSKQGHEKELSIQEDATEVPVLKQKSMRRRHSKPRSVHNDAKFEDLEVVRKPRNRRRDETKRGLQILFDDERQNNEEEERIIDRLLIHYSKKPAISVPEKAKRRSKSRRRAHQMDNPTTGEPVNGIRDGADESPEMIAHPPRSVSLPREESGAKEVNKVFARAATFQPDRSNEARHVHPKLPDYDDLAARIAALRGS